MDDAEAEGPRLQCLPEGALDEDLVDEPARAAEQGSEASRPELLGIFPTKPPSSDCSEPSSPTSTTNGKPATAATSPKAQWRCSTPSAILATSPNSIPATDTEDHLETHHSRGRRPGSSSHAQQIRQQGGVADVVLHPPVGVAGDPQRMGQMQPGPALGDHVRRPVPPPARLHRHLRLRAAGSDDLQRQVRRRVVDPRPRHPVPVLVQHDHHRPLPVQVDPYVRSHGEPPRSWVGVSNLEFHRNSKDRTRPGRLNPSASSTWHHFEDARAATPDARFRTRVSGHFAIEGASDPQLQDAPPSGRGPPVRGRVKSDIASCAAALDTATGERIARIYAAVARTALGTGRRPRRQAAA